MAKKKKNMEDQSARRTEADMIREILFDENIKALAHVNCKACEFGCPNSGNCRNCFGTAEEHLWAMQDFRNSLCDGNRRKNLTSNLNSSCSIVNGSYSIITAELLCFDVYCQQGRRRSLMLSTE